MEKVFVLFRFSRKIIYLMILPKILPAPVGEGWTKIYFDTTRIKMHERNANYLLKPVVCELLIRQ